MTYWNRLRWVFDMIAYSLKSLVGGQYRSRLSCTLPFSSYVANYLPGPFSSIKALINFVRWLWRGDEVEIGLEYRPTPTTKFEILGIRMVERARAWAGRAIGTRSDAILLTRPTIQYVQISEVYTISTQMREINGPFRLWYTSMRHGHLQPLIS